MVPNIAECSRTQTHGIMGKKQFDAPLHVTDLSNESFLLTETETIKQHADTSLCNTCCMF